MGQSFVAGIIFIIFALILGGKPGLIWQTTENGKIRKQRDHPISSLLLPGFLAAFLVLLGFYFC